jgi:hypothetical protein
MLSSLQLHYKRHPQFVCFYTEQLSFMERLPRDSSVDKECRYHRAKEMAFGNIGPEDGFNVVFSPVFDSIPSRTSPSLLTEFILGAI